MRAFVITFIYLSAFAQAEWMKEFKNSEYTGEKKVIKNFTVSENR